MAETSSLLRNHTHIRVSRVRIPPSPPLFVGSGGQQKSFCACVAQLDRVPGYEPGGRRFESFHTRHIKKAHLIEVGFFIPLQKYQYFTGLFELAVSASGFALCFRLVTSFRILTAYYLFKKRHVILKRVEEDIDVSTTV